MTGLGAHPHRPASASSPDTPTSAHGHAFMHHHSPKLQAVYGSDQPPNLGSGLAEMRASTEDMQSQVSGRLSGPVGSGHGSLHNSEMVDILLTDSPRANIMGTAETVALGSRV